MSFFSELFSPHSLLSGGITSINDNAMGTFGVGKNNTFGALNDALKHGPLETSIEKGRPANYSELETDRAQRLDQDPSKVARPVADIAALVGMLMGGSALAGGSSGGGAAAGSTGAAEGAGAAGGASSAGASGSTAAEGAGASSAGSAAPAAQGSGSMPVWQKFLQNMQMPSMGGGQQQQKPTFATNEAVEQPAYQDARYAVPPGQGGHITGPGTSVSDSVDVKASNGEYILNKDAVDLVGKDQLDKLNEQGIKRRGFAVADPNPGHYANGGFMNFGAFAGGLSHGFESGMKIGKSIRDVIKENKMQETLASARSEAAAAYDAKSQGGGSTTPTSGPIEQPSATTETPSPATPTPEPTAAPSVPAGQAYAASPTANPDVAGAATAASSGAPAPSVSTQSPAPVPDVKSEVIKPTPQQAASATPQAIAATGVPSVQPAVVPGKEPLAKTASPVQQPAPPQSDPAGRAAYIEKHMAQKAQEHLISIGDIEGAEKWGKHAETASGRAAIKDWAAARAAPDIDTRAKNFGKYYSDHINDGVDYSGHKILTKEDGTQVAVVALKDKRTGKTSEMELTDQKMIELGDAWNPAAAFRNETARVNAAAAQKAKMGEEAYKSRLKVGEEAYKQDRLDKREGIKATNAENAEIKKSQQSLSEITLRGQIEAQNVGEKSKAELTAKTDALKAAGYSDDEIKPMVPMLLKVGEYKKMTDPAERRAIIGTELMKSDPTFSRSTAEEQKAKIDKAMSAIMGDAAPGTSQSAGKPAAAAPVYVRDKTTGQVYKLEGGKKVPVGPAPAAKPQQAGPAGGVPPQKGANGSW